MTPCRKTGANVWITSHECILHGDLFRVGDVWILHYVEGQRYGVSPAERAACHAVFNDESAYAVDDHAAFYGDYVGSRGDSHTPRVLNMEGRAQCLIIHDDYVECEL